MSQSVEWEWLVHDNSPEPSAFMQALCATDPRVRYFHSAGERQSIGWKRNLLIGEARAPLIAHFDDDDYYAPHYLADMIRIMRENDADLIKLSEFYLYAPGSAFFGYMDLNAKTGLHFALAGSTVESIEFHDKMKIGADFVLFYGFSYIYKKPANASFLFDDISLCEDESFIRKLVSSGAKVIAIDDRTASCLHLVHPRSTSRCFARYTMPPFLLPRLFPGYGGFPDL